ncbi:MAG: hypothetical protein C0418_03975 [Coriobacteriaceae bacterium]|nr:hypothetical protein [Coriobacteriaceae bacterium]
MSLLSDLEDRLAGAVEGLFAGAFRSPVQPAEVAKALGKAMDDGRRVGVGKVYAPTAFEVALSPEDAERMGEFARVLEGELVTYLLGASRQHGYTLASRPTVTVTVDEELHLGRFRVAAGFAAETDGDGRTVPTIATVTLPDGHDVALHGSRVLVGRLASCDIRLEDANISRTHAAFIAEDDGWSVEDLGSTNGTLVNGRTIEVRQRLADGDAVLIGLTKLVYRGPGARG